ncbi:Transcriptional regulatory protein moc3 [Colletotrichum siamense]|uniref:Transcriptional regulatory protein moc3 n=1 Tax=Colletotrichum siamense TaxID=690259 RepID=A0A9P5BW76_COLSI|nr:Transcriptional regulatory protein moc3 [Colletotrichum siamense]KAF4850723.1 Transcriptional regulatory protein moc3 [Colletotrichum siamense]
MVFYTGRFGHLPAKSCPGSPVPTGPRQEVRLNSTPGYTPNPRFELIPGFSSNIGCFECSKRRISCDRTEPECEKCQSRGLRCSGLGIRHRFSDGIAARGFWVGKTIQEVFEGRDAERQVKASSLERISKPCPNSAKLCGELGSEEHFPQDNDQGLGHADIPASPSEINVDDNFESTEDVLNSEPLLQMQRPQEFAQSRNIATTGIAQKHSCLRVQPSPAKVASWALPLLLHFSDHIAGEMVAIDGLHNGWRHLVLPIAHLDQLVLNSVLTVASFHRYGQHLSQSKNLDVREDSLPVPPGLSYQLSTNANPPASQLYAWTIADLQRRDLGHSDQSSRLSILLAILVLLVAVMVTGSDDFPLLFRLLESALEAIGGEDSLGEDELSRFIVRQVHKMRVYAAPLINEQWGITTLSTHQNITQAFECIRHCSQHQPEHYPITSLVMSLIQQSYDIYLDQAHRDILSAASGSDSFPQFAESICRVQRFKETFESFPADSPEHKSFFREVFASFYKRSGFENLRKGMDQLERVWKRRALGDRWISLLPQAKVFIM